MAYRRATAIQFSSPSSHRGPPTKDQSPGHQPCPQTGTLADRRSRCHCLRLVRLALIRLANNGLSHCRAAYEAARVAAAPCPRLCLAALPHASHAQMVEELHVWDDTHTHAVLVSGFCFRFPRRCSHVFSDFRRVDGVMSWVCVRCARDEACWSPVRAGLLHPALLRHDRNGLLARLLAKADVTGIPW